MRNCASENDTGEAVGNLLSERNVLHEPSYGPVRKIIDL
jgi:hypothetical protein